LEIVRAFNAIQCREYLIRAGINRSNAIAFFVRNPNGTRRHAVMVGSLQRESASHEEPRANANQRKDCDPKYDSITFHYNYSS
jgi:hypothetical protein